VKLNLADPAEEYAGDIIRSVSKVVHPDEAGEMKLTLADPAEHDVG
jgi:hypothetical protein